MDRSNDAGCLEAIQKDVDLKVKMGGGLRYNKGKAQLQLVPNSLDYAVAKVLEYGTIKYDKHNWREGMDWAGVLDCAQRHLKKWQDGEECDNGNGKDDKGSGLPHLWHAACNIAMLIEFAETYPEGDDRFKGPINTYKTSFEKHKMIVPEKHETIVLEKKEKSERRIDPYMKAD